MINEIFTGGLWIIPLILSAACYLGIHKGWVKKEDARWKGFAAVFFVLAILSVIVMYLDVI